MLRHFVEEFLNYMPLQMPTLLDCTTMSKPKFYDEYALIFCPLPNGYDLEEVMDILEDDMELITLYHHIPSNQSKYKHSTCAYSNPGFGQMFKINAETDDAGMVQELKVTIFGSIDHLCTELCLDLTLHERNGYFKFKRSKDKVLLDFM